ncbi:MAG: histidine phosphatase family protein [Alicyclobacillus sp.]|nr:histidine phosphatase family protein [Alicyclobacillus sp.]
MLELWIVRHGETDWNLQGRIQGWTDIPMNATGQRQVERLAESLRGVSFIACHTSDLLRARSSAAMLCAHRGIPVLLEPDLRERRFGALEGQVRGAPGTPLPPDAEPEASVAARGQRFLERMVRHYSHGRVLCVSHGGMIRTLLQLMGCPRPGELHNTGLTRAVWRSGQWNVLEIDWCGHLATPPQFRADVDLARVGWPLPRRQSGNA